MNQPSRERRHEAASRPHANNGAIWKLALQKAQAFMSAAVYSRRFIGASALAVYAFSTYPVAEPTSAFSLSLAQGADSVELDRKDAFAANVRQVAARVGVKNPDRLSIRIAEEAAGASLGANATIGWRGACIILPAELYDAYHASPEIRAQFNDIPTKDEINFVLAHESAHIAKNHSLISATFLPISMISACYAIKKIPNKLIASLAGCAAIIGGNMWMSWRLEHEADHVAAANGYAHGGINCFERKLSRNCELRTLLNTKWITEKGNYLGDASHPLLTSRILHLKLIANSYAAASEPCEVELTSHSSCKYCLRV